MLNEGRRLSIIAAALLIENARYHHSALTENFVSQRDDRQARDECQTAKNVLCYAENQVVSSRN